MPQEDDSLKAEMAAQLRADWERARERRAAPPPAPVPEPAPAVEAEQAPGTEAAGRRRFSLRRRAS
jgi:hypothetical protein